MSLSLPENSRFALGTVQFGTAYGIANRSGQVNLEEAAAIIGCGRAAGLNTLDTAVAYGSSETTLGQIGVSDWRIVTKLPVMPSTVAEPSVWVRETIESSLERLGVSQLDAVLLHVPDQLLVSGGERLAAALQRAKEERLTRSVGVSIYDADALEAFMGACQIDVVQAPFNLLDRRIVTSGWAERLNAMGVELHVRSIFLQGLLLMASKERPARFQLWSQLWSKFDIWIDELRISPIEACLRFALFAVPNAKLVIGVDSERHLRQILDLPKVPLESPPNFEHLHDERLITPSLWSGL